MDIEKLVNAINDSGMRTRANYHLTLGGLIRTLKDAPEDALVLFSDGIPPDDLDSYRGYYSDIAISNDSSGNRILVSAFLAKCTDALGNTFEGYKGGDFVMDDTSPLWRAGYGHASGIAIVDAVLIENVVRLITKEIQ